MPQNVNGTLMYNSAETAKKLHISRQMLRYFRDEGRIKAVQIGLQYFYTQEAIDAADLSRKKRERRREDTSEPDPVPAIA